MTTFEPEIGITSWKGVKIPKGTTTLALSFCGGLTSLPENLPDSITGLDLTYCDGLTWLPKKLPANLTILDLSYCGGLTLLPKNLPDSITALNLSYCSGLTSLPEKLPANLTMLDLRGCCNLPNSPALVRQLTELENNNRDNPHFRLIWPDHIDRNPKIIEIKENLTEAYKEYYKDNEHLKQKEPNASDQTNYPTLTLFHRYMGESVESRGGMSKVIESIISVAQSITDNPQILESIDEVSKGYLAACVNQPVAGFTEVANLVNISKQTDIPSKLEASRAIMCINLIRSEIKKLKVGEGVEAELANAMLMKVHEKLLLIGDISNKWPGVPDGVAYQGAIKNQLTGGNINSIYSKVRQELRQSLENVANFMCEGNLQDFWMKQVLDEEDMKKPDIITQLRDEIYSTDPNEDTKLLESSERLRAEELNFRTYLLTKSKEITYSAIQRSPSATIGTPSAVKQNPNIISL
jgi:hypothetical protein